MSLNIPWYILGNWKLDVNQLNNLKQNLLVKENCKGVGLYTTYDADNKNLSFTTIDAQSNALNDA